MFFKPGSKELFHLDRLDLLRESLLIDGQ